jgi:hypothetical protein
MRARAVLPFEPPETPRRSATFGMTAPFSDDRVPKVEWRQMTSTSRKYLAENASSCFSNGGAPGVLF